MNKTISDFFGHIKIFLVSIGISWSFLLGAVTEATTDFGFKASYVRTPTTYITISITSVIVGIIAVLAFEKKKQER